MTGTSQFEQGQGNTGPSEGGELAEQWMQIMLGETALRKLATSNPESIPEMVGRVAPLIPASTRLSIINQLVDSFEFNELSVAALRMNIHSRHRFEDLQTMLRAESLVMPAGSPVEHLRNKYQITISGYPLPEVCTPDTPPVRCSVNLCGRPFTELIGDLETLLASEGGTYITQPFLEALLKHPDSSLEAAATDGSIEVVVKQSTYQLIQSTLPTSQLLAGHAAFFAVTRECLFDGRLVMPSDTVRSALHFDITTGGMRMVDSLSEEALKYAGSHG